MDKYLSSYKPYKDGIHNDSKIIEEAIEECSINNDRLIIEEGLYKCGSIKLRENTSIYLKKGAVLKLSDNKEDFYNIKSTNKTLYENTWDDCSYNGNPSTYFIYGVGLNNVKIDGEGLIDGSEEYFIGHVTKYHIEGAYYPRTPLIYLEDSKNIEILNINICKSAFWTIHLVGCNTILIDGINIKNSPIFTNCDGIDPDHCKNITIRNSSIYSADDCIVLKNTKYNQKYGPTENVVVYNCRLKSTSSAIKIGTESVGDFKNIKFYDIEIYDSNRGISLMQRDGANISNVSFENIKIETHQFSPLHWWGRGEMISITNLKRDDGSILGSIKDILFRNIDATSENGVVIYGNNISNIIFDTINLHIENKTSWPKTSLDLRPSTIGVIDKEFYDFYSHGCSNYKLVNCSLKKILEE